MTLHQDSGTDFIQISPSAHINLSIRISRNFFRSLHACRNILLAHTTVSIMSCTAQHFICLITVLKKKGLISYHHHLLCCSWALEMHQVVRDNKGATATIGGYCESVNCFLWMYFLFALVQQVHSISSQPPNLTGMLLCTHTPLSYELNFTNCQTVTVLLCQRQQTNRRNHNREEYQLVLCSFQVFLPKRKILFWFHPRMFLNLD